MMMMIQGEHQGPADCVYAFAGTRELLTGAGVDLSTARSVRSNVKQSLGDRGINLPNTRAFWMSFRAGSAVGDAMRSRSRSKTIVPRDDFDEKAFPIIIVMELRLSPRAKRITRSVRSRSGRQLSRSTLKQQ